jgi:hypothetical protein
LNGRCVPVCNASTGCSAGCCDINGACQLGEANDVCGQNGNACQNCTSLGGCDLSVTPRTCANGQKCQSSYPGCNPGLMQPPPTTAAVCPANDLANAAMACGGGANTTGCQGFFQFEQQQRPQCAACLAPFDFDFNFGDKRGVDNCTVPFLSPVCNHEVACLGDCETTTCSACMGQAAIQQCESGAPTAQCSAFGSGVMCVQAALAGPAAFCAGTGNFGTWLQTVGTHYCLQ